MVISLNNINEWNFVIVECYVFFQVVTEFVNIM